MLYYINKTISSKKSGFYKETTHLKYKTGEVIYIWTKYGKVDKKDIIYPLFKYMIISIFFKYK